MIIKTLFSGMLTWQLPICRQDFRLAKLSRHKKQQLNSTFVSLEEIYTECSLFIMKHHCIKEIISKLCYNKLA